MQPDALYKARVSDVRTSMRTVGRTAHLRSDDKKPVEQKCNLEDMSESMSPPCTAIGAHLVECSPFEVVGQFVGEEGDEWQGNTLGEGPAELK